MNDDPVVGRGAMDEGVEALEVGALGAKRIDVGGAGRIDDLGIVDVLDNDDDDVIVARGQRQGGGANGGRENGTGVEECVGAHGFRRWHRIRRKCAAKSIFGDGTDGRR